MMRVAIAALSARGAMGQYLEILGVELSKLVDLHMFVPIHFNGAEKGGATIHYFVTGPRRFQALQRFANPLAALTTWRQIRETAPDLLHIFNGEGYPWALVWAWQAERQRIPMVVTVHDPEPHPGNFWESLNAALRPFVIKRARSVHVHSACFADTILAQGAKSVVVIPHGSLAARFVRYRRPGVPRERMVLFFGRLEWYKGIDVFVEAIIALDGKFRAVIAGPGRLSGPLLNKIQSRPDLFNLRASYLSDAEVADLFQRASVCVLPYRQASQSSIPLIAAAFGTPVVATAVGAFVEDVPRVGGKLVPPGDAHALAKAIVEAVEIVPIYPKDLEFCCLAGRFLEWYKRYG